MFRLDRICIALLISISIFAQEQKPKDQFLDPNDFLKSNQTSYYLWNAVTGSNIVTDTDIFLYGSFAKTKVPKDSLDDFGSGNVRAGTTSASKYISIYKSFSSYTSDWSADADGWLLDPETPITTYNVDGVWGVDNCVYVPTNMSISDTLFYENLPFEGFIRIQFDYYYGMFGTTILIRGIGNEAFNHNIQPESYMSWNHFDSTFAVSSNIYGVDAISGLDITSSGDSLYLKDFSYDFYYGDSTRTLAKSVSLDDLVEDETYTYYTSVLQPNGRYSKGDDSTFITPFNSTLQIEPSIDTFLVSLYIYDVPLSYQSLVWYKDGIAQDSILEGSITTYTTVVDSNISEGHYYKAKVYGHYTTPVLTDSFYAEPIVPFLPAPTNLYAVGDTTGIKLTWQDNSIDENGFIIKRAIISELDQDLAVIDTINANLEEYCDSIPTITENTSYRYEVSAYSSLFLSPSNIDTATAIYAISDSSIASIDSTIASIDTTAGSSFTPDLLGIMTGTSVNDFSYLPTPDNGHTFTVGDGWYVVTYDSGLNAQETCFAQKTFTGQADSIFVGMIWKTDGQLTLFNAGEEQMIFSLYDSVQSRTVLGFGIDDGTGSDRIADRFALQYWTGGALTSDNFSATGFAVDSVLIQARVIFGAGTGSVTWWANGVQVQSYTGLTNNDVTANAIRIGSDASAPYSSDEIVNESMYYDNIYVDSRSNPDLNWWESSEEQIDTTYNYDTTYTYTLIAFNCGADEPPEPPLQVTGLDTVSVTTASVNLIWTDLDDEAGYRIERKLGNQESTEFVLLSSNSINDTTYTDNTVAHSTDYTYRVRGFNSGGNGDYSDTLEITTDTYIAPEPSGDYTDTLYVSASATGSGTGQTVGSPYTLSQAISNVNAGNLVILAVGAYDIEGNLDFTRDGTTANPIEWRGTIDASDSAGLTYSANSTVFYPSVFSGSNTNPPFEVFGEHNTFKNILFYNNISQQVTLIRVDADAVGTTFDGINFKYPINTASSSHHSIRIYCDSVTIKNSYFNRGSRCIIWIETNGDGDNTVDGFLVENNVFTGASNHPAIQLMPNTFLASPNKVANGIIRNNLFIDNPYSALYLRWFESLQVYNNVFIRSGVRIVDIDKSSPTELDSVNSKGSIFAFNTLIGTACTFTNRQHNQLVYANNLIVGTTLPSSLYWFGNNATGEARFDQRHYFDYNYFYYSSGNVTNVNSTYCIDDDSYITVNWTNWLGTYGFDTHSTINIAPTFTNSGNDDYTPLNGSSPQVGKGTPITISAGFIGDILYDKNGVLRSATTPTVGAYEYTVEDLGTYHIDYENGDDANTGLNTEQAWQHAPNDPNATGVSDATTLVAGDTVVFKGGVEYLGQITSIPSGNATDYIVFKGNSGWGTGNAIFDLEETRAQAFVGTGSYIKIQGITFTGWTIAGGQFNSVIRPSASSSRNWIIDSCSFAYMQDYNNVNTYDTYKPAIAIGSAGWTGNKQMYITNNEFVGTGRQAVYIRFADSLYITGNNFGGINRADSSGWFSTAVTFTPSGVDITNVWIQNNTFHDGWQYGADTNPETKHSPNWLHFYGDSNDSIRGIIIEDNIFYNDKQFAYGTGSGMISFEDYVYDVEIKNNLLVNACAYSGWMIELGGSTNATTDSILIENNTFVARNYTGGTSINGAIVIYTGAMDSNWIRNNIFYDDDASGGTNWVALRFYNSTDFAGVVDYNSYFSADTTTLIYFAGDKAFSAYRTASGFDTNSEYNSDGSTIFTTFPVSPANSSSGNYTLSASASEFLKSGGYGGVSIGAYEYVP